MLCYEKKVGHEEQDRCNSSKTTNEIMNQRSHGSRGLYHEDGWNRSHEFHELDHGGGLLLCVPAGEGCVIETSATSQLGGGF